MRIIIFGLGNTWRKIEKYVDITSIIGFTDSNSQLWGRDAWGRKIIPPREAVLLEFDKIVIASELYEEEILRQLYYDYHVPKNKIMGWMEYVQVNCCNRSGYNQASFIEMAYILSGFQGKLLDMNGSFVKYGMFSKRIDNMYSLERLEIWGTDGKPPVFPIYANIYKGYCNLEDSENKETYDIAVLCDSLWGKDPETIVKNCEKALCHSKAVLFNLSHTGGKLIAEIEKRWNFRYFQYPHSCICLVWRKKRQNDIRIYVAAHKKAWIPKDDMYIPIHVGNDAFSIEKMVRDDSGDNIAGYNASINECTAMYWMWKNVKCRYIGLNHYRRYFLRNSYESIMNLADADTLTRILDEYDVILAPKYYTYFKNVEEHLSDDVCNAEGIAAAREIIKKRQPEYLDAFDGVFQGNSLYRCNLFVMKKCLFDDYCEWLFSFILEISDAIDTAGYDSYSKRMAGFIAERMLTVWLVTKRFRIREMPSIVME